MAQTYTLVEQAKDLDNTATFVQQRYQRMVTSKVDYSQRLQAVWELMDEPTNWLMYADYFSTPIRTNTLRDVVNNLVDLFMKNPPEAVLEAEQKQFKYSAIAMQAYIDGIKESIHEKKIKRQVIYDMFQWGNGFRSVMYHNMTKMLKGEKMKIFDDLATSRIDPRRFFMDESCYQLHDALRLEQARDCINKRWFDFDTFKSYFSQIDGVKNLDKVQPVNFFNDVLGTNYYTFNYKETTEKSEALGVHVYEYMNQADGRYILIANRTCIYEGTLIDDKGTDRIPVVQYQFEPRPDSPWGKSIGEILAPYIYMEDTLLNLELMNIKLTLQPVLAVSGDFGFNPRIHVVQPGGVWTAGGNFSGKIGDSIQPIVSGNSKTNFYNMQNLLRNKITESSRADLRNLDTGVDQTATQVLSQTKSYNSHNEYVEHINEIEAEGVLTELMLDIIHSYMNTVDEDGNSKRVKVKGFVVRQSEGMEPTFLSRSGEEDYFDMVNSVLDAELKVSVRDKRSEVAESVEKVGRWMQFLPLLSNLEQLNPEIAGRIDWDYILAETMEAIDINSTKALKQTDSDYVDQFSLLKDEILFGHNIDVPQDEEREDSTRRLRFLIAWSQTKQWKEGGAKDPLAERAWSYHFDSTMQNIQRSHITPDNAAKFSPDMAQLQAQNNQQAAQEVPQQGLAAMPIGQGQPMQGGAGQMMSTPQSGDVGLGNLIPS